MHFLFFLSMVATGMSIAAVAAQAPPDPNKPKTLEDLVKEDPPDKYRMYLQPAHSPTKGLSPTEIAERRGSYVNLDAHPDKVYRLADQPPFRIRAVSDGRGNHQIQMQHVHDVDPSKVAHIPIQDQHGRDVKLDLGGRGGMLPSSSDSDDSPRLSQVNYRENDERREWKALQHFSVDVMPNIGKATSPQEVAALMHRHTQTIENVSEADPGNSKQRIWKNWVGNQDNSRLHQFARTHGNHEVGLYIRTEINNRESRQQAQRSLFHKTRDAGEPADVIRAFKQYHEQRPESPLSERSIDRHWYMFASTKELKHLRRLHGTRLDDDHYQMALHDAKRRWSPEAQQHAKTLSFEAYDASKRLALMQHDPRGTAEQLWRERAKLEQQYGDEAMKQAEQQIARLHLTNDAARENPKNRKMKAERPTKGKRKESSSKSRQGPQSRLVGEKEQQEPQRSDPVSKEEKNKGEQIIKYQEERALRQKEKEAKKHKEWLQERKERQSEEQRMREERQLHERQKQERERERRKAKAVSKKQAMRGQQQEEMHLSKAEEQKLLRQQSAEAERLQLRKERQKQETEAQRAKDRAKHLEDPHVESPGHLRGARSRSPSSSRSGSRKEQEHLPSSDEVQAPPHRAPSSEMHFINDPAQLKPIEDAPKHALPKEARPGNPRALRFYEGRQDSARSPLHQHTIQDRMRPPTPRQHSVASGEEKPQPEPEPPKKFREALEKGQRAPLAEEHTNPKAWPPLTAEQQRQRQQPPRVHRPQAPVQAVPPGQFSKVQMQQHAEQLREQQRKYDAQRKHDAQAKADAAKNEIHSALAGLGKP